MDDCPSSSIMVASHFRCAYLIMDADIRHILETSPKGTIIINLDGKAIYNAISLKEFKLAIDEERPLIITPLTYAIDNFYATKGYRVLVESEGKQLNINRMLLGYDIGPNDRELRLAHNVERLILNGVYDIETNWEC